MSATTLDRNQIAAAIAAEQERLSGLLAGLSDPQLRGLARGDGWTVHDIVGHIADSVGGIVYLITQGPPPGAGPVDRDVLNEQWRQAALGLGRADLEAKLAGVFDAAQQALATADLGAPGPFGPDQSLGEWFMIIVHHTGHHRAELAEIVAG